MKGSASCHIPNDRYRSNYDLMKWNSRDVSSMVEHKVVALVDSGSNPVRHSIWCGTAYTMADVKSYGTDA